LVGVTLWGISNAIPTLWQSWDNWVFDREVHGQPANLAGYLSEKTGISLGRDQKSSSTNPIQPNALLGRISIPRLHLSTTVREGTGADTLSLAAGHLRGTALPGGTGNVAVAAHRDTLFSGLGGIWKNDSIEFETLQGRYKYQVASFEVVSPTDVSVLKARSPSELTLITCYPFDYIGPAPQRFIVKARQVTADSPQPATQLVERQAPVEKGFFYISKRHSRQLAPGISIGVDETDAASKEVKGWLWVMPDRRTIWLRDQPANDPLVFYQDGERRELLITKVTDSAITGYLR
jgi:LPXTG-site transpeptidase (sortase) family protein